MERVLAWPFRICVGILNATLIACFHGVVELAQGQGGRMARRRSTPYGNAWDLVASAMEAGIKLQLQPQWQPISWSAEVPEARLTTYATQPYYRMGG